MTTQTDYLIASIRQRAITEAELLRYGGNWLALCERLGLSPDTPAQEVAALVEPVVMDYRMKGAGR